MGMTWPRRALLLMMTFIILGGLLTQWGQPVTSARAEDAQDDSFVITPAPDEPVRKTKILIDTVQHTWWLIRWSSNHIQCEVNVDHDGLPSANEIYKTCGPNTYEDWVDTQSCSQALIASRKCDGLYLHEVRSEPVQREMEVNLPMPSVWLDVQGCDVVGQQRRCTSVPNLELIAEEPLPNEHITSIQVVFNGETFTCPASACSLPLKPTGQLGAEMEFWAESSFGDTSKHYTAIVRVQPRGDFMSPENPASLQQLWYLDVLSSQYRGAGPLASCADIWQALPAVGGPPDWLTTPDRIESLQSTRSYYFLSAMLIRNGAVDASGCPNNGLQSPMVANTCGVQVALPEVVRWQNTFDQEILNVSHDTGVPAQLMKNIFSRESQFWPGMYKTYKEAGLGQMTSNGADTVLLWDPQFYAQFCPLVLHSDTCKTDFMNLKSDEQEMLRGALVRKVNAACPDCLVGIDLSQANFSVKIFAESLLANCRQVSSVYFISTGQTPGRLTSYVDLWKFALVNYNAGPGCLQRALETTYDSGYSLTWENVSQRFEPVCQSAVTYVNEISQVPRPTPTPTAWLVAPTLSPTGPTMVTRQVTVQSTIPPYTPTPGGQVTPTPTETPEPYEAQPTNTPEPYD